MEMKGRNAYFILCLSWARSSGIVSIYLLQAPDLPASTSHHPSPGSITAAVGCTPVGAKANASGTPAFGAEFAHAMLPAAGAPA